MKTNKKNVKIKKVTLKPKRTVDDCCSIWALECPKCGKTTLCVKEAYEMGVLTDYFVACNNCGWVQPDAGSHKSMEDAVDACNRFIKSEMKNGFRSKDMPAPNTPFVEMKWQCGNISYGKAVKPKDIVGFIENGKLVGLYYMTEHEGKAINLWPLVKGDGLFINVSKDAKYDEPIDIKHFFVDCMSPDCLESVREITILANESKAGHPWDEIRFSVCDYFAKEKKADAEMPLFYYEIALKNNEEMCHFFMYSKLPSVSNQEVESVLRNMALEAHDKKKEFPFERWMLSEENIYYVKRITEEEYLDGTHNGNFYGFTIKRFAK